MSRRRRRHSCSGGSLKSVRRALSKFGRSKAGYSIGRMAERVGNKLTGGSLKSVRRALNKFGRSKAGYSIGRMAERVGNRLTGGCNGGRMMDKNGGRFLRGGVPGSGFIAAGR